MEQNAFFQAFLGSLVADAVSMPVHWYYNTAALDEDYGVIQGYQKPKNPHPDSILWRSRFVPKSDEANILHAHAKYWGQRNIHYHQDLESGENTLNFRLACELYQMVASQGRYDEVAWLTHYVECMRTPGWNRDTYLEEYHRAFFDNLASGKPLLKCGIDDKHIGGLSSVPALLAVLSAIADDTEDQTCECILGHVNLTHKNQTVLQSTRSLVKILQGLKAGESLDALLQKHANAFVSLKRFEKWSHRPDREVIGRVMSPACYIEDSFPASLYLAWKYQGDFDAGIRANAMVGGDNCHRGVVVGSILGLINGVSAVWLDGLKCLPGLKELENAG
ncbi:MAG: ADP-ribosylglycohydrolase family protein [Verrucomicrobiota bacterium]